MQLQTVCTEKCSGVKGERCLPGAARAVHGDVPRALAALARTGLLDRLVALTVAVETLQPLVVPEPIGAAGQVRGAERREVTRERSLDAPAARVGLQLHEHAVGGGAAVGEQRLHRPGCAL